MATRIETRRDYVQLKRGQEIPPGTKTSPTDWTKKSKERRCDTQSRDT